MYNDTVELSTIKPARETGIAQTAGTTLSVIYSSNGGKRIQIQESSHFFSWSTHLRTDLVQTLGEW